MAANIKQHETEGNEVLSADVIILEAVTLSPFPSHPDTTVPSCVVPLSPTAFARMTRDSSRQTKSAFSSPVCLRDWRQLYEAILWLSSHDKGIKSSLGGRMNELDRFRTRGTTQADISACAACQDAGEEILWGRS